MRGGAWVQRALALVPLAHYWIDSRGDCRMEARLELAALNQRTLREPQLLVGCTIRAVGWDEHAREVILELTDGNRAMLTAELHDGVPVLVLGEGKDAALLRELVQAQRT